MTRGEALLAGWVLLVVLVLVLVAVNRSRAR